MSRLDRLVSLLDTGYSSYIRNVAAEQIADVQKSRPEELFNLLARVTPFLQSPKWETRITAARAVGLIAENTVWDPSQPPDISRVTVKPEIKPEFTNEIKNEVDESSNITDSEPVKPEAIRDEDYLQFSTLDITSVIQKGTPLLGSAGREYDQVVQTLDSDHRLKMQQQTMKRKIGMDFLGDDDTTNFLESELLAQQQHQRQENERKSVKASLAEAVEDVSMAKSDPKASIMADHESVPSKEPVNARLRALAKRKARFGSPQAPVPKARKTDCNGKPSDEPVKENGDVGTAKSDTVVVEHRVQSDELLEALTVSDPLSFPFELLWFRLLFEMFEPTWETRHGALLCLRELVRTHGKTAGMRIGDPASVNAERNRRWLEDLACRLCCIFALDRFADYVSDQAVAPVRESAAQTLGALLLDLPNELAQQTFAVLQTLVINPQDSHSWAACHGGLLGLRYFVTLKRESIVASRETFANLVQCVFRGLTVSNDDEVQAVSAAVLLPIADGFVEQRPESEVAQLLSIMWNGISDMKDELSTSVGSLMDLLATLCTFPTVLTILLSSENGSLAHLVPKLYPFLRHSIIDVRKAVLRSLKTFLTLEHGSKDWISLTTLRLVYQNILLEQNDQVLELSMELWHLLLNFFQNNVEETNRLTEMYHRFWPLAFPLLMTPIGSARRFYKMDTRLLIKPSGESYASATPASASSSSKLDVNIDGPMIQGDSLIVEHTNFIRVKVNGSIALGRLTALAASAATKIPDNFVADACQMFDSHMSSQHLTVGILFTEFGRYLPPAMANQLAELASVVNPLLLKSMDAPGTGVLWRDINPILRAVRTQCQSLFTLLMSQGELDASLLPKLPATIEGDAGTIVGSSVFTLAQSRELATSTFYQLRNQLSTETQVRMADALDDGRKNLVTSIEEAESALENRNTSIRAVSAAAYIMLNPEKLPSKLNPIIRGLMDDTKTEAVPLLHERTSTVLAQLIQALFSTNRSAAGNKIVKNLCGFLCVDVHEAPEFDNKTEDCILSLKRDDIKLDNKNVAEMLRKERESRAAYIKRQGAILTLSKLANIYKGELLNVLSEVKTQMSSYLVGNAEVNMGLVDKKRGQGIIDNLAILRTLLPYFSSDLHPLINSYLPDIVATLYSPYPVIRHAAARCVAEVCRTMPSSGITYVVKEILGKSLVDAANTVKRQGAIEAIFHMMLTMGEQILPYIVFFIVPVLGRMSDSNNSIRMISATAFASIIKLVPLESGVSDPEDIPKELLEGKEKEREFIGQMMDPSRIKEFELPIDVKAELRKYQRDGINWLAFLNKYNLHGILCDDMGLGKTLQTICMVASDHVNRAKTYAETKSADSRRLPSLIICPTTLTGHWCEEFERYVPGLKVEALVGSPRARQAILSTGKLKKADIVVTSYDTARNEVSKLSQYDWNYCVLDEGHIIKNAASKLTKAVKLYKAYHRLVLTGTPIQNNVLELWSLFDFLMPGFLGNEKSFNERFSKPIAARSSGKASPKDQEAATLALEALHKQVLPFTLRRLKEDVLDDLPPKIIQDYYCDLSETQRKLYDKFTQNQRSAMENDAAAADSGSKAGDVARNHIFQALQYMRKLCNHPSFVTYTKAELEKRPVPSTNESPKLMALQQLLKDCGIGNLENPADGVPEAMSQHRALIFCQQREMLDLVEKSLLQKEMPSVSYLRMDGSIPGPQRQKLVTKFNEDPSIDVLLLTTHVGGLGLNLTGADTVIFVEHDWNPMNDLQAMDRAHRLGQKRVVNVYRLITRHTLEERIMGLQQFKLNVASSVINQQNKGLMSMGTDQILELFSSSADADAVPDKRDSTAEETAESASGTKFGKSDVVSNLGELWDESEYAEEYNIDKFIKSLKK